MLEAVTERTKLVYVCHPNNPTGTMNTRAELDEYFDRVPDHVVTVLDQAYFEYIDEPDYRRRDRGVPQARPRSRRPAHVLEDLRARRAPRRLRRRPGRGGHGDRQGPARLRRHLPAQVAALASLAAPEPKRSSSAAGASTPRAGRRSRRRCGSTGFDPVGPAVANFVFAEVGEDSRPLFEQLLRKA